MIWVNVCVILVGIIKFSAWVILIRVNIEVREIVDAIGVLVTNIKWAIIVEISEMNLIGNMI